MTKWISAPDAFAIVVSHEVAPDLAKEKILAAIKDKKLPVRARMVNFYGEDHAEVEVLPMSFWEVTDAQIEFEEATARSINICGSIPPLIENARDLEFSENHLFKLWPKPAKPSRSIKSQAESANVPLKLRGRKGHVTRGIADRMKAMNRAELEALKDEQMVTLFAGGKISHRSKCQTARKLALSEMPVGK
jgi:hypothetical protein